MASKKDLKKEVKRLVYDIMDECDYILENDGKEAKAADKLMDEAVAFYEDIIPKIIAAKTKEDFKGLIAEIEKANEKFNEKMNAIQN